VTTGNQATGLLAAGAEALTEAAFRTGDYAEADALLREALAAARTTGDRATEAAALDRLGWLMHFTAIDQGLENADADAEEALFQQALAIRRDLDDPAGIAQSLFGVGLVNQVLRRDWVTAAPLFREALALAEQHGDLVTRSEAHRHVGFYHLVEEVEEEEDDPAAAVKHLRTSLDLREQHGDPRWIPSGTLALGQACLVAGDAEEGLRLLRRAVDQARAAGLHPRRIEQAEGALRRAEAGELPQFRPRR
jgi:tetratricopeptide (TPR) repeat protein